jgi:hypothetical protein
MTKLRAVGRASPLEVGLGRLGHLPGRDAGIAGSGRWIAESEPAALTIDVN